MKKEIMKKKLTHYLSLSYPLILLYIKVDKLYVVQYPDLPGCMAHGSTPTKAVKLAEQIKKEWIESALESGHDVPIPRYDGFIKGE